MTFRIDGCELSRMMLGTVQFGMPYGVANRTGQPDYQTVREIVAAALEGGVNCFDTAAAYGTSEEVLGRALQELGCNDRTIVVTKVRPLSAEDLSDSDRAANAIEQSVLESRTRLQRDCLPLVLFHRECDAVHSVKLEELQRRGWLRMWGVSCDNRPGPAARFIADPQVSALQIPGNLIDQRHQRSGIFQQAAERDVAIFIRSVYLQGLLLMPEANIPPELQAVIPLRNQFRELADAAGLTLAELALRYMLSQSGVTSVITGVETVQQVRDNLRLFSQGPLSSDVMHAIDQIPIDVHEKVITPSQWPPRP